MNAPVSGLTGGIACGKSTVSKLFSARGAAVVDADLLAREVTAPRSEGLAAVVDAFGVGVLDATGALDREALGRVIFADSSARARLNAVTHPRIAALSLERIQAARETGAPLVIYDAALLFESGRADLFRPVIVVSTPYEVQVARLRARDGLTAEDAAARVASQMPLAEKVARADHVIDNGGELAETERQVEAVWRRLMNHD